MRNAIAHNAIVSDVRFKTGGISKNIGKLLKSEAGIDSINFSDITDYVILVVYLLGPLKLPKTDRKRLVSGYEGILLRYKKELPRGIYGHFVLTEAQNKLKLLKKYVMKS